MIRAVNDPQIGAGQARSQLFAYLHWTDGIAIPPEQQYRHPEFGKALREILAIALNNLQNVDFVKIDVEGFELEVLAGLRSALERSRPVVVLEMNHWCLNALQRITLPEFIDTLLTHFPVLYAVNGDEVMNLRDPNQRYKVTIEHITQSMKFQNLIGCYDEARIEAIFGHR